MTNDELLDAMREIYEIYAGSEVITAPVTLREKYLIGLIGSMRDIAGTAIKCSKPSAQSDSTPL